MEYAMEARRTQDLIFTFLDDPADIKFVMDLWKSKQPNPSLVRDEDVPLIKIKWDSHQKQFYFSAIPEKLELIKYLDNKSNIIIYGHGFNNECVSSLKYIEDINQGKAYGKLMTFTQLADLIKDNVVVLTVPGVVSDSRVNIDLHICKAASDSNNPSLGGLNSFAGCLHGSLNNGRKGMKTTMHAHQDIFYIIVDDDSKSVVHGSSTSISRNDSAVMKRDRLMEDKSSEVIFLFNENNVQVIVQAVDNPNIALHNQLKICQRYLIVNLNQIAKAGDQEIKTSMNQFIQGMAQYNCLSDIIVGLKKLLSTLQGSTTSQNTFESKFLTTIRSMADSLFHSDNPLLQLNELIQSLEKMTNDFKNAPFNDPTVPIYVRVSSLGQPITTQNQLIEILEAANLTAYLSLNDLMQTDPVDQFSLIAAAKGGNSYQNVIKLVVPKECLGQLMFKLPGQNSKGFLIVKPDAKLQEIIKSSKLEVLSMEVVEPKKLAPNKW
jgi:hypothetical protein